MSLPLVSKDTYASVCRSVEEDFVSDSDFMLQYLEHIEDVNPVVHEFIEDWSKLKGDKLFKLVMGMCYIYKLLESQSEAQELEASFAALPED